MAKFFGPTRYLMIPWTDDLIQDYHAAAIRLATLTESRVQHLLFAVVELYPNEVRAPPTYIARQRKNFGNATLSVGVAVMPVANALAWYESALTGSLKIPGLTPEVPVVTLHLSPEPMLGRLLISNDVPFALHWHAGPRVHRLVPMDEFPESISRLSSGKNDEREIRVRGWLADHLGFDVLAYDDFLCGLALLAPNPVARSVGTFIKEIQADGSERLRVKAVLRQGISAGTLCVRLQEERPGGTTVLESRLDPLGIAEFVLPEQCERSGLQLICDRRGVLTIEPPAHFFRSVHVSTQSMHSQGHIEVPARRKGAPSTTYPLQTMRGETSFPPVQPPTATGALRLSALQGRRLARTGYRRPDGFLRGAEDDERIFLNDRLDAISFVHRLVRRARERVIFVDPYFDQIDLREFAFRTQTENVSVSVLTGRGDHLWRKTADSDSAPLAGDLFADDLVKLDADLKEVGREIPAVRLMGEDARIYHDRFLVIDDLVWHFGHSFNQVGRSEVSMATRLTHPQEIQLLICEDVDRAESFVTAWPSLKMRREQEVGVAHRWVCVWQRVVKAAVSCLPRRFR